MVSPRVRIILFGIALALLVLLVAYPLSPVPHGGAQSPNRQPALGSGKEPQPAISGAVQAAGAEERSRLADNLNSPSGDVHADLRLVNEIFIAYRSALRTGNPVGENSEITAALTGRNRLGYAFIPADSRAINAKGELCDRWGTPYFLHQLSGERMEVRSAGPDHRLWTADDEVLTP